MRGLSTIALLVLLAQTTFLAQGPGALFSGPLPSLLADQEVVIEELTLPPGFEGSAHRHDAYVYVYVVQGTVDMQVEGDDVQRVQAGQVFVETPEDVHLVMNNPSDTESARFVAFIIKTAGAPVGRRAGSETN